MPVARLQIYEGPELTNIWNGSQGTLSGPDANGGGRNDVQFCVQCHNTTNSGYNRGINSGLVPGVDDSESGSMANMVHRIHRGVGRKTAMTFHDTSLVSSDVPQKVVYPGILRNCVVPQARHL